MDKIKEKIKQCWSGNILWDCSLKNYTTLKVGGKVDALIKPGSIQELEVLVRSLQDESVPWKVLGRGSNIVVSDDGVEGVVIVLGDELSNISWVKKNDIEIGQDDFKKIYVEAGCSLTKLLNWCQKNALGGIEFVAGIPGSVGGAVIMNAGAWGSEIGDVIYSVDVMGDCGQVVTEVPQAEEFQYRKWNKKEGAIVVAATMKLTPADSAEIEARCYEYTRKRNEKQPKGVASAGSFFKNAEGAPAGMLIDKAGLKGTKIGGAQVSKKHANFFVNTGQATALDFYKLMQLVQHKVFNTFNVELEAEVEFIGRM